MIRLLEEAWEWWCAMCGLAAVAGAAVYALLQVPVGAVVTVHSGQHVETASIPVGHALVYDVVANRLKDCPGFIAELWTRVQDGERTRVDTIRQISSTQITTRPLHIIVSLPPGVSAGRWRYTSTLESTCGLIRVSDVVASFDITVE